MECINHVSYFFWRRFYYQCRPALRKRNYGRPFQSPFAKPPGEGLSSSTVNVLWGSFNIVVGYELIFHVGCLIFVARDTLLRQDWALF